MRNEIDFLPPGYRHRATRSRSGDWRWSIWAAVIIGIAITTTDLVLRYRLRGLHTARIQTERQAEVLAQQSAQIDQLSQRHHDAVNELEDWSTPLETDRATEVLDIILAARPDSLFLKRVEWDSRQSIMDRSSTPTLRIAGVLEDLGDVVSFVRAIDEPGVLPRLEVRQSGLSNLVPDQDMQSFVIETALSEGRR